jgi:hypothetical protein
MFELRMDIEEAETTEDFARIKACLEGFIEADSSAFGALLTGGTREEITAAAVRLQYLYKV